MPASRNSLDQRASSSPADLNFPQLLLQQGAECSGSSGFSFISDCCPSLSPRREKSGLRPPAAFSFGNTLVAEYVFERQLVRSFENVEIFHALHMFPSDKITHYEHVRPGDGPFQSFQ
jgi:hypothetical protein